MADDLKARPGRRPKAPEKRRERFPLRLRLELHEQFKALGGPDWIEPLLEAGLPASAWEALLALPADELRQRLGQVVQELKTGNLTNENEGGGRGAPRAQRVPEGREADS